jgi:hypothetical protein
MIGIGFWLSNDETRPNWKNIIFYSAISGNIPNKT